MAVTKAPDDAIPQGGQGRREVLDEAPGSTAC